MGKMGSKSIRQMKPRQPAHSLHRGLHSEVLGPFVLCACVSMIDHVDNPVRPPLPIPHPPFPHPASIPLAPAPAPAMGNPALGEDKGQGTQAGEAEETETGETGTGARPARETPHCWHPGILASHPGSGTPPLPIASPSRDCAKPCAS